MSTESPAVSLSPSTSAPTLPTSSPTTSSPSQQPSFQFTRPIIEGFSNPEQFSTVNLSYANGTTLMFPSIRWSLGSYLNAPFSVETAPGTNQLYALAAQESYIFQSITHGSLPIFSSAILPNSLVLNLTNASVSGWVDEFSDLTAYPLACVSVPSSVALPMDFTARLVRLNSSSRGFGLNVSAYGATGLVDETSGAMQGFRDQATSYPLNVTEPYFCSVFWFGLNMFNGGAYDTNVIATAFHDVRAALVGRNESTMVFPDDPGYSQYEVYLFIGGIPFMALAAACIICFPSFVILRSFCSVRFNKYCRCCARGCGNCCLVLSRLCCCLAPAVCCKTQSQSTASTKRSRKKALQAIGGAEVGLVDERDAAAEAMEDDDPLLLNKDDADFFEIDDLLGEERREILEKKREREELEARSTPWLSFVRIGGRDRGRGDGSVNGSITSTGFANAATKERQDPNDYQRRMEKILAPPKISKRLCLLFGNTLLMLFCVTATIGFSMSNTAGADESFDSAAILLSKANNLSISAISTLDRAISRAGISGENLEVVPILRLERDRVARLATMTDDKNLRVVNKFPRTLQIPDAGVAVIEYTSIFIEFMAPILVILSLTLASCTCRWNEIVLFENISICLGFILKGWLILCATAAWFCMMFIFWQLAVLSDICYLPSILSVPVFNSTGPLLVAPIPFDPADSNNYMQPPNSTSVLSSFFFQCKFSEARFVDLASSEGFNPYIALNVEAASLNNQALLSVLNQTSPDPTMIAALIATQSALHDMETSISCNVFGFRLNTGMGRLCYDDVIGTFLVFFFLGAIAIFQMIVIPLSSWVSPNLYRQWQANKVYDRASRETEKVIAARTRLKNGSRGTGRTGTNQTGRLDNQSLQKTQIGVSSPLAARNIERKSSNMHQNKADDFVTRDPLQDSSQDRNGLDQSTQLMNDSTIIPPPNASGLGRFSDLGMV